MRLATTVLLLLCLLTRSLVFSVLASVNDISRGNYATSDSANGNNATHSDDADGGSPTAQGVCIPTTAPPIDWVNFFRTVGVGHPSGPTEGLHRASSPFCSKEFGAHFWAVLIGNNEYSNPEDELYGCINDADLVATYLRNYLQVPLSHMVRLLNASHSDIIVALHNLRDNEDIKRGSNLLFFYAGHGSRYVSGTTKYNAICPVDRGFGTLDITMLELDSIFSELQRAKGNNVTAIFDCCHSGDTSSRSGEGPDTRV